MPNIPPAGANPVLRAKTSDHNISDEALKKAKADNKDDYKNKGFVLVEDGKGQKHAVIKSGWKQNETTKDIEKEKGLKNKLFHRNRGTTYGVGGTVLGAGVLYGGYKMMSGDDSAKTQDPTLQGQSMQGYA